MARWSSRSVHAALAFPILAPLLLTITTGFAYRFSRNVLLLDKPAVHWLLSLHSMALLGLAGVFPLLVAAAVAGAALTGVPMSAPAAMWRRAMAGHWDVWTGVLGKPAAINARLVHRAVTGAVTAPLVLSALTGALWTVQTYYLGYTRQQAGWLMGLHQGSFSGSTVVYTGALFVGTLVALGTGFTLIPWLSQTSGSVRVVPKVPSFFKEAIKQ